MKTHHAKLLSFALILIIGVSNYSCLLTSTQGNVHPDNLAFFLFGAKVNMCDQNFTDDGVEYECVYGDNGSIPGSIFFLRNLLLTFLVTFFDPIIVQVPAGATDISGTITASNGISRDLDVKTGFTTLPADINNNIVAEPGMQLVILDFPQPNPFVVPDDFDIELIYQLPPGPGPFEIKAMSAGKVPTEEGVFYPPIFPCVNDFADVPAINIPESDFPLDIDLSPYEDAPVCEGLVYDYTGLTPINPEIRPIPTVSHWGLIAMAGIFGLIAIWAITRRRVTE